jgi:hypothetical protein
MKLILLLCSLLVLMPIHASVSIRASDFNQLYSCENPFVLTTTTTIVLNEDIEINECFPFVAEDSFSLTDTLTFTSRTNNNLIIAPNCIIDGRVFLPQGQSLIFAGNIVVKVGYRSTFVQNGSSIITQDNANIIFESIVP